MPTCIKSSSPSAVHKVIACPAACIDMISPSHAATSTALTGSIERPSPTIFWANTGSGTRSRAQTWPDKGARILTRDIGSNVEVQLMHASPPGLGLDTVGQPAGRVVVSVATNPAFEIMAPKSPRDERPNHRTTEEFPAPRDLRRERDLPQASVRAECIALGPVKTGFERNAEAIREMIDGSHAGGGPAVARTGASEFGVLVYTHKLHRKMFRGLNRDLVGDTEAPRIAQVRPGGVGRAGKIVGGALAVRGADLVFPAPKLLVLGAMNQPDRPAAGAFDVQLASVRIENVLHLAAACVRVIEPEGGFAKGHFYVVEPKIEILFGDVAVVGRIAVHAAADPRER